MTIKLASSRKTGYLLVLGICLIIASLFVLYTTRDAAIQTTRIIDEWPIERSLTTDTILTSDCMQFLGDRRFDEDGTAGYSWLGTQDQYDQCWNALIEKMGPVRYIPMIRVEALGSEGSALENPFSDRCTPYWSELSEASDLSKVYVWTGTELQHFACISEIHSAQTRLEELQSGKMIRPSFGTVIYPPELSDTD